MMVDEQVGQPIAVRVAPGAAVGLSDVFDARAGGDVYELHLPGCRTAKEQ